jgi:hypothetical protein
MRPAHTVVSGAARTNSVPSVMHTIALARESHALVSKNTTAMWRVKKIATYARERRGVTGANLEASLGVDAEGDVEAGAAAVVVVLLSVVVVVVVEEEDEEVEDEKEDDKVVVVVLDEEGVGVRGTENRSSGTLEEEGGGMVEGADTLKGREEEDDGFGEE